MNAVDMFQFIARSCVWIAIALVVLFFVIGIAKIAQMWLRPDAAEGLATAKHAGAPLGIDKILDSAAKLTESLSKAPLAVVSIVMALLFMLLAVLSAYLGREPAKPVEIKQLGLANLLPGDRCVVEGFASGEHRLPDTIRGQPDGCLNDLAKRLKSNKLGVLLVVGRCDIQELRPALRARYTENLSLAYRRGVSVSDFLASGLDADTADQFKRGLLVVVGGAHQDRHEDLAKDRVVELIPFWTVETKVLAPAI